MTGRLGKVVVVVVGQDRTNPLGRDSDSERSATGQGRPEASREMLAPILAGDLPRLLPSTDVRDRRAGCFADGDDLQPEVLA